MTDTPVILGFFVFGLAVYATLVFWAGKRGILWLAILLSLPAAMGGAMRLFVIDVPPEASPLSRYFGWLVLVQLAVGVIAYRAGRAKTAASISSTRNTQG